MNRAVRLAKIEATQKLCDWCEFREREDKAFRDSLLAQGVELHVPKLKDLKYGRCGSCGVQWTHNQTFMSLSDRQLDDELSEQQRAANDAGQEKMPPEWWAQWLELFDRCEAAMQKFYGTAYDVAVQQTKIREFREILASEAAGESDAAFG